MKAEMMTGAQLIPNRGPRREALRDKGQFWTPAWVAEAMVWYVTQNSPTHIFDPAVGDGAFFRAAKSAGAKHDREIAFLGNELDPGALEQALCHELSADDLAHIEINDFILNPPAGPFKSIVANPPYIRHHRLSYDVKQELRRISINAIGTPLDGRAGLHIYFLIRALSLLDSQGHLAFIMPADTCEGVFSSTLWNWIANRYRIDAVVTFSPDASPFPQVDTNPIIFMISNNPPRQSLFWANCITGPTQSLKEWIVSGFKRAKFKDLEIFERDLREGISTGLSRPPMKNDSNSLTLGNLAKVMRGIATGCNDFFFLTRDRAKSLGIPSAYLVPAIGRTRDVPGDEVTCETLEYLDMKGRPTLLFSPNEPSKRVFPTSVQEYLDYGKSAGVHKKSLIATRRPWYKMETRTPPPILFTYLGRRNTRFIRNSAGVVPLTGFLCVYPYQDDKKFVAQLWQALQLPETIANLSLVGKSYGGGAIKVEPRALEKLPIPTEITSSFESAGLLKTNQTKFW